MLTWLLPKKGGRLILCHDTMADMSLDDYMTTQEVADKWHISRSAVLKLISRGKLDADKHGRDYLISKQVVENYERKKAGRPKKIGS